MWHEPKVVGNRFAPHSTPGVSYDDYTRQEVAENFFEATPAPDDQFPRPKPTSSSAWKGVGYVGFGGFGPVKWNNVFVNMQKKLPENFYAETYTNPVPLGTGQPKEYLVYEASLTDERYELSAGNEMQLTLIPRRLDAVWGVLYGETTDGDNDIRPSDDDQSVYSTVLRLQLYLTNTVHLLGEGAIAKEISHNGNRYREHEDSIGPNDGGSTEVLDGLQFGDADTRNTVQGKFGFVLNPTGIGVYNRPSLRILYGVQYSSQNNAFGNSFSDDTSDANIFGTEERHLHHVVGLEAEAWF
jgi:hypothetical protein